MKRKKNKARRRAKIMAYIMLILLSIIPIWVAGISINKAVMWYVDVLTIKKDGVSLQQNVKRIKPPICPGILKNNIKR